MAGEQMQGVDLEHPWSPPHSHLRQPELLTPLEKAAQEKLGDASQAAAEERAIPPGQQTTPTGHGTLYCYLPGMDFLILFVFHFGLDEEGYWSWRVSPNER